MTQEQPLIQIAPFKALRYNPERISFISRVIAPPFDVIEPAEAEELRRRDPHNVIRVTLGKPKDEGRTEADYREAAQFFRDWRREGVLMREPDPAVYVCEQEFELDGRKLRRRGLICTMLLEEFSSRRVLPHERTMEGPKADRLRLMEACQADLSPVFGVFSDPEGRADRALQEMPDGLPAYEFRDADDVAYRVWRAVDAERIGRLAAMLREQVLFIADGHHRYETALRYRESHRRADAPPGSAPEDLIMVFCVSVRNPGLHILPTHRLVRAPDQFDRAGFLAGIAATFELTEMKIMHPDGLADAWKGIEGEGIGCYLGRGRFVMLAPRKEGPLAARLPVIQLHHAILEPFFDIPAEADAAHPRLLFCQEVQKAFWRVESGSCEAAFFLPPTPPAAIEAVARAGERMPPKSTFFYPKICTGLAFYAFDETPPLARPSCK